MNLYIRTTKLLIIVDYRVKGRATIKVYMIIAYTKTTNRRRQMHSGIYAVRYMWFNIIFTFKMLIFQIENANGAPNQHGGSRERLK